MKRIAVFIGLKVVEIMDIVFVPWLVGSSTRRFFDLKHMDAFTEWFFGVECLLLFGVVFWLIGFGILANWEWAGRITGDVDDEEEKPE